MHAELAGRRAYLHPFRWTCLGLSLIEAMTLGMPVVALATTEAAEAVPPAPGWSARIARCWSTPARRWLADPDEARETRPGRTPSMPWSATGCRGSWPTGSTLLKEVAR